MERHTTVLLAPKLERLSSFPGRRPCLRLGSLHLSHLKHTGGQPCPD